MLPTTPNRASDAGPDAAQKPPINRQTLYSLMIDEVIDAVDAASDEVRRLRNTYCNTRSEEMVARCNVIAAAAIKLGKTLEILDRIREVV